MLFNGIPIREQEHIFEQTEIIHSLLVGDRILDYTILCTELMLVACKNYYNYNITKGITTIHFEDLVPGISDPNLTAFKKEFAQGNLQRRTYYEHSTKYCVTEQTGLWGIVLWYINWIKTRNSPGDKSPIIIMECSQSQHEIFKYNLEFIRKFAATLELIK